MRTENKVLHNRETNTLELYALASGSYDIPLDECGSHKALVWWINHMARQTWFNMETLRNLLAAWEKATGLSASGDPLSAMED